MKTIQIFEVGEDVLIRARVSQVIFEKDRIKYILEDTEGKKYNHHFSDKDITPFTEEEE